MLLLLCKKSFQFFKQNRVNLLQIVCMSIYVIQKKWYIYTIFCFLFDVQYRIIFYSDVSWEAGLAPFFGAFGVLTAAAVFDFTGEMVGSSATAAAAAVAVSARAS